MAERGVTFKQALNDLISEGQTSTEHRPQFSTKARPMGLPVADLDKALRLAGGLENAELIRCLEPDTQSLWTPTSCYTL